MRTIKFRAWDNLMNKFLWTDFEKYISEIHSDKPLYERTGLMHIAPNWIEDNDRVIFQQYTGLKDKNGKEIYEGDIVNQEKWVSVGKYEPSIGIVKYKGVGFTCECVGNWFGANADLNGNAEVIGNVHEHPELLESRHEA